MKCLQKEGYIWGHSQSVQTVQSSETYRTRMWANAQRDGRPVVPNIGGALCSTPQSLADAHNYRVPCSNAAKTRNPLKLPGVPKTNETISAASGPKFTMCGHM